MSQEAIAQPSRPRRSFEERADATLRICVGIALAVVVAFGMAQWAYSASSEGAAKPPALGVEAGGGKTKSETVHRCADGQVSFTPCS